MVEARKTIAMGMLRSATSGVLLKKPWREKELRSRRPRDRRCIQALGGARAP